MVFVQLNLSLCKYRTLYKNDKFLNIFVQSLHTWIQGQKKSTMLADTPIYKNWVTD